MNLRANLILVALAAWETVVVKPFYAAARLLGWPERSRSEGDDGSPE